MLTEMLGLQSDGFAKRLVVRRPLLPDGVHELALHDVRVAGGAVSLRFVREGAQIKAAVTASSQGIEVMIHEK
jgi:hypothetical protein